MMKYLDYLNLFIHIWPNVTDDANEFNKTLISNKLGNMTLINITMRLIENSITINVNINILLHSIFLLNLKNFSIC